MPKKMTAKQRQDAINREYERVKQQMLEAGADYDVAVDYAMEAANSWTPPEDEPEK